MSEIKQLKALVGSIPYGILVEFIEEYWACDGDTFKWVAGREVYSGEITEGDDIYSGYTIANVDSQMGYWITMFFNNDKELHWDEFEEMQPSE